jgi:CRISPR-associated protein Csd1
MLQPLVDYARIHLTDSEPGFTTRNVRWLAEISADGRFINVLPLGNDTGELTTKCPDMHNMTAGGRAHFLVESLQTVALYFRNNETQANIIKATKRHDYFVEMLKCASATAAELYPLSQFFENSEEVERLCERVKELRSSPSDWVRWSVAGVDPLKQETAQNWWRFWRDNDLTVEEKPKKDTKTTLSPEDSDPGKMLCLLTGKMTTPLLTHPKVGGLAGVGGLGTKDVMVGFDKSAFCSYGFDQAKNAAMNEVAARGYVDALEHLISNHYRKLANTLVVHWFKEAVKPEDDPLDFLYEPPVLTEAAAQNSVRQLLAALRTGQRVTLENNRYYAMTLSGASGRVMVRDWMEGSFEELVARIDRWFADLEIVAQSDGGLARAPKFNEACLSMVRYPPCQDRCRLSLRGFE